MSKPILTIVPTQNGFVVIPFDMNLMLSMKDAATKTKGCYVAGDTQGLAELIQRVYELDLQEEPNDQ